MSDKLNSQQRQKRALIRLMCLTGGLGGYQQITGQSVIPKQWIKPVVDQVVLPAHGGTSVIAVTTTTTTTTTPAPTPTLSPEDIVDNIIDPILLQKKRR